MCTELEKAFLMIKVDLRDCNALRFYEYTAIVLHR